MSGVYENVILSKYSSLITQYTFVKCMMSSAAMCLPGFLGCVEWRERERKMKEKEMELRKKEEEKRNEKLDNFERDRIRYLRNDPSISREQLPRSSSSDHPRQAAPTVASRHMSSASLLHASEQYGHSVAAEARWSRGNVILLTVVNS